MAISRAVWARRQRGTREVVHTRLVPAPAGSGFWHVVCIPCAGEWETLAEMGSHGKIDGRTRMTATRHCGKVLIVDPDRLTRWSVKAYLGDHLEVLSAESAAGALQVLSRQAVEAVVVSEDLPNQGADKVEIHARSGNPCVVIVRTVSEPVREGVSSESTVRLEKPFKLSRLAELLGVGTQ